MLDLTAEDLEFVEDMKAAKTHNLFSLGTAEGVRSLGRILDYLIKRTQNPGYSVVLSGPLPIMVQCSNCHQVADPANHRCVVS